MTALHVWLAPTTANPTAIPVGATEGNVAESQQITVNATADGYLILAQPQSVTDISRVDTGGFNWLPALAKGVQTFTDDDTTYEWWRSSRSMRHSDLHGEVLTVERAGFTPDTGLSKNWRQRNTKLRDQSTFALSWYSGLFR